MSGYVDKSDLKELGFSGIDAAKFLTWILDCRKESGNHRLDAHWRIMSLFWH